MRIFHIIRSLDPAMGGPPAVVLRLAAAQAQEGENVTVVAYSYEGIEQKVLASMAGIPGIGSVAIQAIGRESKVSRFYAGEVRQVLDKLVKAGDIVHLHGVWDVILLAASRVAGKNGAPYVVTPHGMLDPWSLSQKRWKKSLALGLGYRAMLEGACFLHVLNDDEKRLLDPLKLAVNVETLPNGLFQEEIEPLPPPGTFRGIHPELGDAPYVLFLSRLHFKKGLDYLVDAFKSLCVTDSDVQLVIAGPDDGMRDEVVARVKALGLADRVHLVGPLYGEDKLSVFAEAAVFCLPSRQEGFSVALLEAMGCGLPVVISKSCHFDTVEEYGAGSVVDLNSPDIAAALKRYLEDESLRKSTGRAAHDLVLEHYTWPGIAKRLLSKYKKLLLN